MVTLPNNPVAVLPSNNYSSKGVAQYNSITETPGFSSSLLKITNNNISYSASNPTILSGTFNGITVFGTTQTKNGCIIRSNHISSDDSSYIDGVSLSSGINSPIISGNNIFGFKNNGILLGNLSGNAGYISGNNIGRGDSAILSFISGSIINNSSSALITDNYFNYDTVDGYNGTNWQDVVKGRGSKWIVERNINQTEEITVDGWVGSKNYRQSPITKSNVNFYLKNKIDVQGGVVKFIVDNSISEENDLNITLLTSCNTIYKKQAWNPHGPLAIFEDLSNSGVQDPWREYVWFPSPTSPLQADPATPNTAMTIPKINFFRYASDISWFRVNGVVGNTSGTFSHPFYTATNYPCNISASANKIGSSNITITGGQNINRIVDFIQYNGGDNTWNDNTKPKRCRISGSSSQNNGIYEITELDSGAISWDNFNFKIKRIIGVPAGVNDGSNTTNVESINLSSENNEFVWTINPEEILPDGAKVIYTKCNINTTYNTSSDGTYYSIPIGNLYLKAGGQTNSAQMSGLVTSHTLELSGLSSKTPIRVVADMVAISDYKEADISGLTVRYKW